MPGIRGGGGVELGVVAGGGGVGPGGGGGGEYALYSGGVADGALGGVAGWGMNVWALVRRSLGYRRGRSVGALVALTVSAAVATALLTLYADLDQKLHREFRSFGANVVVTGLVGDGDLYGKAVKAAGADAAVAEFGYAVATTDRGTAVVVAGVDFPAVRKLDSWWQVESWPTGMGTRFCLGSGRRSLWVMRRR